jgi:hypothetical protein
MYMTGIKFEVLGNFCGFFFEESTEMQAEWGGHMPVILCVLCPELYDRFL